MIQWQTAKKSWASSFHAPTPCRPSWIAEWRLNSRFAVGLESSGISTASFPRVPLKVWTLAWTAARGECKGTNLRFLFDLTSLIITLKSFLSFIYDVYLLEQIGSWNIDTDYFISWTFCNIFVPTDTKKLYLTLNLLARYVPDLNLIGFCGVACHRLVIWRVTGGLTVQSDSFKYYDVHTRHVSAKSRQFINYSGIKIN